MTVREDGWLAEVLERPVFAVDEPDAADPDEIRRHAAESSTIASRMRRAVLASGCQIPQPKNTCPGSRCR